MSSSLSSLFSSPLISATSTPVGEWVLIYDFEKPVQAIIYDPTSRKPERRDPSALGVWAYPYHRGYPMLTFTELIVGKDRAEANAETISINSPDAGENKYKSIQMLTGTDFMVGTREERVPTIKFREMHPAIVFAASQDKVSLELAIEITVQVDDPIVALSFTNFLGVANALVVEVFRKWCASKSYDLVTKMDTDSSDPHLPDEITLAIKELNRSKFRKMKIKVPHVALIRINVGQDSASVPASERGIIIEANNLKTMQQTMQIELLQNKVQAQKNATQLKFIQGQYAAQVKLINDTKDSIVDQNKALAGDSGLRTLIINDPSKLGPQVQTIQVANAAV